MSEGARVAWSQPVASLLLLGVTAAVCAGTLATAGQTVAGQRAALVALGDVQARTVEVRSVGPAAVDGRALDQVARMSAVEFAAGLGQPFVVHPPGLRSHQAPAVRVVGVLDGLPDSGEEPAAFVSRRSVSRAGLETAAGALQGLDGGSYPVLGWFTSPSPLVQLEDFVVVRDPSSSGPLERLVVVVSSVALVERVADAIGTLRLSDDSQTVTVQRPEALLHARRTLQGEFTAYGRSMVLAFEAAGTLCIALLVFAATLARRRDFGRRRALGASRSALAGLVVVQTMLPATAGAVLGTVGGAAWLVRMTGTSVGWPYPVAVATLTLLSAAVAALGPSLLAAWRDPVTVLRTP
jgi:putative ABC transport system permease protein